MPYRRTPAVVARLADRRAGILAAAIDVAERDGLPLDVRAVAAGADIAVGTLYLHYADQDELAAAVIAARLARDLAAMAGAAGAAPNPLAAVAAAIAVYVHRVPAMRALAPSLTAAPAYRIGIARELERRIAAARGEIAPGNPALRATAVYGALNAVLLAGAAGGPVRKDALALICLALRAIGAPAGDIATLALAARDLAAIEYHGA